eukprot:CAMPEP_0118948866 /NCGR_PEP_ID=MMETSP1169-20130426/48592_1 /TAXON_ID=36882 /ORGANISM="Pyramimonas obovata, Strain CCMP722" /LENGTH=120 /DNA_ID=CAMNT_0006895383 /DNA_START=18 /DNA_END=375 /DNA_ORIENTATION=+
MSLKDCSQSHNKFGSTTNTYYIPLLEYYHYNTTTTTTRPSVTSGGYSPTTQPAGAKQPLPPLQYIGACSAGQDACTLGPIVSGLGAAVAANAALAITAAIPKSPDMSAMERAICVLASVL